MSESESDWKLCFINFTSSIIITARHDRWIGWPVRNKWHCNLLLVDSRESGNNQKQVVLCVISIWEGIIAHGDFSVCVITTAWLQVRNPVSDSPDLFCIVYTKASKSSQESKAGNSVSLWRPLVDFISSNIGGLLLFQLQYLFTHSVIVVACTTKLTAMWKTE